MNHRERTEIITFILKAANTEDGSSKGKIMYESFVSFSELNEYLSLLLTIILASNSLLLTIYIISTLRIFMLNKLKLYDGSGSIVVMPDFFVDRMVYNHCKAN